MLCRVRGGAGAIPPIDEGHMKKAWTFLKQLWALTVPYFKSRRGLWALLFFLFLVGLSFLLVRLNVEASNWNNRFFTALQKKDEAAFWSECWFFLKLGTVFVAIAIFRYVLQQIFQIRWREWLTDHFMARWLATDSYYRLQLRYDGTDNPDQRISEDLRIFVTQTLGFSLSFISNAATLVSFSFVLWGLSEPIENVTIWGISVAIPGLLFWVALLYAALVTAVLHFFGRPLAGLNFEKERREANFRFDLVRVRENAEAIALYQGQEAELGRLQGRFQRVKQNFYDIMNKQKIVIGLGVAFDQTVVLLPYVFTAPVYFLGNIPLGNLTQTSGAFGTVQNSFSWFANIYTDLAEWVATVRRLTTFLEALQGAETARDSIERRRGTDSTWEVSGLELELPSGRKLAQLDLVLKAGEDVLILGPSGAGKSTLFRALAGIWPFGRGKIASPELKPGTLDEALFLPQRPYIPIGALRAAVTYPQPEGVVDDARLSQALVDAGLSSFATRLDEVDHWQNRLSGGELQRLAIARALVQKPDWLFLDEATSAMDEEMERNLYAILKERLPATTIVSIGHRSSLKAFHQREIHLAADSNGISTIAAE